MTVLSLELATVLVRDMPHTQHMLDRWWL